MKITGKESSSGAKVLLYQDLTDITTCTSFGTEGTHPCDDILLIPINNTQRFQLLEISVEDYLSLCEVLVYAGNTFHSYVQN